VSIADVVGMTRSGKDALFIARVRRLSQMPVLQGF
jgi:hypothetical protein